MTNHPPTPTARRADACVVLVAMVLPTLITWLYFVVLKDAAPAVQQGVYTAGKVLQFGLPIVWVAIVQRQRLRLRPDTTAGVAEGVGFGLLVFAAMFLLYHAWLKPGGYFVEASGAIREKVTGFGIDGLAKYVALGAFYALAHSFLEEYYYRWFVFGQLRRFIPLWAAIILSSLAFMAHHVIVVGLYFGWFSWLTMLFCLAVAAGGAIWAWIYHRSGSLVGPWLSHLAVDAAIFAVGYDLAGGLFARC